MLFGVAIVVDDWVGGVVLELVLLIVVPVTDGDLIQILEGLEEQVHVVNVDG